KYREHTDETLLSLLQKHDREGYTEIYLRYHGILYVFAYNRLKNREEAKDIIHELFLKLWTDRTTLHITSRLSVYLYTAVRNPIINSLSPQQVANRYIDPFLSYLDQIDFHSAGY